MQFVDITLPITPEIREIAKSDERKGFAGHVGTHFDVMGKEFPLEYSERVGVVFDVSDVHGRDILTTDIDLDLVGKDMFVGFRTGFVEKAGYGSKGYFSEHPQLSVELIDVLVEKGVSIVGLDFAGIRRPPEHTPTDARLANAGTFVVENLCGLDALVACEQPLTICTYPMKYIGLTGLPCRVIARVGKR